MTLRDAAVGSTVVVSKITGDPAYKRRIMDMGITKGSEVYIRKVAPLGEAGYPLLCGVANSWIESNRPSKNIYAVWQENEYTIEVEFAGSSSLESCIAAYLNEKYRIT